MGATQCHCCGGVPDTQNASPRYCYVCRGGCQLVAKFTILRGPSCPFRRKHGGPVMWPEDVPRPADPVAPTPSLRPSTASPARAGTMMSDSFEWRGRRRRNVPGG